MMSASKAVLADAMREDFEQLPPGCPRQASGHALRIRSRVAPVVVGVWLVGDGGPLYRELEPLS